MKNAPVLHAIEYAVFRAIRALLLALPHAAARSVGRAVGRLASLVDARHRRVAQRNLAIAFPERSPREHRALAVECFRHFGGAICDAISADRFDLEEFCQRIRYEGWEHLIDAEAAGKGLFVLGSHLGYWEYSARPIGLYRGTVHAVARPTDNPHLNRELVRLRERFGYAVIPKKGAARRMLQLLKQGERVGILIDQRVPPREAIAVEFFGRECLATPILARLSLRAGTPVLPVFAYPEPRGRYRVVVRPPIWPDSLRNEAAGNERSDDEAGAVAALTRRYLEETEREIRAHPGWWLWLHDRWRIPADFGAKQPSEISTEVETEISRERSGETGAGEA